MFTKKHMKKKTFSVRTGGCVLTLVFVRYKFQLAVLGDEPEMDHWDDGVSNLQVSGPPSLCVSESRGVT